MNIRKWVKLALLFSAAVTMGIMVPVTLSYVFDKTDTLVNTFLPPTGLDDENAVEILVNKTVVNKGDAAITPEGFTFVLRNTITGETHTAISNKDGQARFVLTFNGAQAGSHSFYLTELNDGLEGVTYDAAEYAIRIDVDTVDGHTERTLYKDGKQVDALTVSFVNVYDTEQIPETGDRLPMAVLAAMLLCSGMLLLLLNRKRTMA